MVACLTSLALTETVARLERWRQLNTDGDTADWAVILLFVKFMFSSYHTFAYNDLIMLAIAYA